MARRHSASAGGRVTFVGSGDAFGSGGRFNTCLMVEMGAERFFVDFGSSSLIALNRLGIEPGTVGTVLVTHLHADHGGGLPSLLLEAMIVSRRTAGLTIAGPPGLGDWLAALQRAMYPGSEGLRPRFDLRLIEMAPGRMHRVGALEVTALPMRHSPATQPSGLRIGCAGKVFSYTGDSAWTDAIVDLARGADILVCECYARHSRVPMHMSLSDIETHRHRLGTARLVLTHAGPEMLTPPPGLEAICATDGLVVEF